MQRIFLLILIFFITKSSLAQSPTFQLDFEVGFLMFKNDSIHFQKPKAFSITTSGITDIFLLGKSRRYEFGMRVEILVSKLTGSEKYLVGKIYYVKKNNQWQEVMKIEHQEWEFKPIAQREKVDMFIMGGASTDSPEAFDVRLNEYYYLIK